jgi:hypothetical protein
MAFEQWLYEQIDQKRDMESWLRRVIAESESVAFAGVLFDIGKRVPEIFEGVLKPLFYCWEFWDCDFQMTNLRRGGGGGNLGYLGMQPKLVELARQWYRLPHRFNLLLGPDGPVAQRMLNRKELWPFFENVRSAWSSHLSAEGAPDNLRRLIERINPENYRFPREGDEQVVVDFQWPATMARENEESRREIAIKSTITGLPLRCRMRLDAGPPLSREEGLWLWNLLQDVSENPAPLDSDDDEPIVQIEDVLCAAIAALLILCRLWISEDRGRIEWCRRKLEGVVLRPPAPLRFDSPVTVGNHQWDAFAAECGVTLLMENTGDLLARRLVASGVMAFHYNTTAITMKRAFQGRAKLGEDFDRMLTLSLQWAGMSHPYERAIDPSLRMEHEDWKKRKEALVREFVDQKSPTEYPKLRAVNRSARAEREARRLKQHPEYARAVKRKLEARGRGSHRETLRPDSLGIDARTIEATFVWLDIDAAQSAQERNKWLRLIGECLDLHLEHIPRIEDPRRQEIEGLPDEFDGWVYRIIARVLPRMKLTERPEEMWKPILDLGAPAHEWVERFFWYWFTDGSRSASSSTEFVHLWSAMIQYALQSPLWDPSKVNLHDLDSMVVELLGFDGRWNATLAREEFAVAVGSMRDLFGAAARRWFCMPAVVNGFVAFGAHPAAAQLLLPGVRWLAPTVQSFDTYDWKYGFEDNLVEFLDECWRRESRRISSDYELQKAFFALLGALVSRGGHAAIALRDRIISSGEPNT